jgi:hypothetical protein
MNSNKGNVIFWVVVAVIAAGVGGFFGVRSMVRASKVKPFKEHLAEYTKPVAAGLPGQPVGSKKMAGKCVTVDMDSKEVDYVYFDLPEELRAETPDQVGTVVQLKWGKEQVGDYKGKPAWKHNCTVTVVDRATMSPIASSMFWGSDPPSSIKSSQSEGNGDKPYDQIVNFVKGQPR